MPGSWCWEFAPVASVAGDANDAKIKESRKKVPERTVGSGQEAITKAHSPPRMLGNCVIDGCMDFHSALQGVGRVMSCFPAVFAVKQSSAAGGRFAEAS